MKTTTLLLLIVVIAATGCNMQKRNRRDSSEEVLPRVSTASERTLPPPSIQTRDNLDLLEESEETSVSESLPTIQKDKETFFWKEEPRRDNSTFGSSSTSFGTTVSAPHEEENPYPGKERIDSLREVLLEQISGMIDSEKKDSGESSEPLSKSRLFRCCVLQGGQFRNQDRMMIRVLENIDIDGVLIRKNEILEGYCTIGSFLEITIPSVKDIALTLEGFDKNGSKGLRFSEGNQERGSTLSSEVLSESTSLLSSRVGRVARDITEIGSSTIQRKLSNLSVNVPSGYEFYLGIKN